LLTHGVPGAMGKMGKRPAAKAMGPMTSETSRLACYRICISVCVCDYAIFTSYIALFFDFAAFRGLCSQANVTLYITLCFSILLYITRYFTYKTYAAYAFVRTLITEAVRMWRIYDSQPQRVFHLIFGGKKAPKKQFAFDLFGFHENFGGF
jgi:hypothetical protein